MPEFERLTDRELIEAFRAGDADAFAAIYDRFADRVFTAHLRAGRERAGAVEATHDTFMDAAERLLGSDAPDDLQGGLTAIGEIGGVPGGVQGELTPAPPALRVRVLTKVDELVVTGTATPAPPTAAPLISLPSDLPPEWRWMGVFAAVTLVVGLIGLAVSAQFDRLEPPPTVVGQDPAPSPGTIPPTTSTTIGVSTTTAVTQSTSTTTASGPASLQVSTDTIDFGSDGTGSELDILNEGGAATTWTIASSSGAVSVSAGSGEIAGGETITIELGLNRDEIGEGDLAETLTLSWPDGDLEIAVLGTHEDIPIIHNPQTAPASVEVEGCDVTRTTVSARVRDTSPLESVVARWSPDGSGQRETAMEPVGNDMFEGVIGPFSTIGTIDVRIVGFDERGNAGGATVTVSVTDCS